MNHHPQGEVCPPVTPDPRPDDGRVPLLRLRGHDRRAIPPEDCLVPDCPVCRWRRDGLIPPVPGD